MLALTNDQVRPVSRVLSWPASRPAWRWPPAAFHAARNPGGGQFGFRRGGRTRARLWPPRLAGDHSAGDAGRPGAAGVERRNPARAVTPGPNRRWPATTAPRHFHHRGGRPDRRRGADHRRACGPDRPCRAALGGADAALLLWSWLAGTGMFDASLATHIGGPYGLTAFLTALALAAGARLADAIIPLREIWPQYQKEFSPARFTASAGWARWPVWVFRAPRFSPISPLWRAAPWWRPICFICGRRGMKAAQVIAPSAAAFALVALAAAVTSCCGGLGRKPHRPRRDRRLCRGGRDPAGAGGDRQRRNRGAAFPARLLRRPACWRRRQPKKATTSRAFRQSGPGRHRLGASGRFCARFARPASDPVARSHRHAGAGRA